MTADRAGVGAAVSAAFPSIVLCFAPRLPARAPCRFVGVPEVDRPVPRAIKRLTNYKSNRPPELPGGQQYGKKCPNKRVRYSYSS